VTTPPESLASEDDHARQEVVVDPAAVRAQRRQDNLERFERVTALPLLVLAIAFIPLLVLPLLFELPEPVDDAFLALDWFIWAAFAAEFIIRLTLSSKRWRFVRRNWADLLIVIIRFLRPLRILRSREPFACSGLLA
jgi:hypothetical protein